MAAKHILFVQGGGAEDHDAWDSKLVASLQTGLGPAYTIHYPPMPKEDDPRFLAWKAAIHGHIAKRDDGLLLVGHSIGATILLHALAEQRPARVIGGLFLIAPPFIGEGGWPSDEITPKADLGARLPDGAPVYLYQGGADDTVESGHADLYAAAIPQAHIRRLAGRDHQLDNDLSPVAADIKGLDH